MKKYCEKSNYILYNDNMLNMLENIKQNSIDSIITDPPYEINFMGKKWDNTGIAFQPDTWKKCFDVLKEGGYLLAFGGSGSTGKAVMFENRERNANYKFIGIELNEEYLPICEARIEYAINKYEYDIKKEKEEREKEGYISLFDM